MKTIPFQSEGCDGERDVGPGCGGKKGKLRVVVAVSSFKMNLARVEVSKKR